MLHVRWLAVAAPFSEWVWSRFQPRIHATYFLAGRQAGAGKQLEAGRHMAAAGHDQPLPTAVCAKAGTDPKGGRVVSLLSAGGLFRTASVCEAAIAPLWPRTHLGRPRACLTAALTPLHF